MQIFTSIFIMEPHPDIYDYIYLLTTRIFGHKHHKASPQNITITSIHHHITKHRFKYENSSPKTKLELSHFKTDPSSNRKKPNKPHKTSHPQPTPRFLTHQSTTALNKHTHPHTEATSKG